MSEQKFLVKRVVGKKDRCWVSYPKDVWLRELNKKSDGIIISEIPKDLHEEINDTSKDTLEDVYKTICGKPSKKIG